MVEMDDLRVRILDAYQSEIENAENLLQQVRDGNVRTPEHLEEYETIEYISAEGTVSLGSGITEVRLILNQTPYVEFNVTRGKLETGHQSNRSRQLDCETDALHDYFAEKLQTAVV